MATLSSGTEPTAPTGYEARWILSTSVMNRNTSAAVTNRTLDPPADKLVAQSLYWAMPAPIVPQLVKKFHAFYGT